MSKRHVSKHLYEDLYQPYKAREQSWTNNTVCQSMTGRGELGAMNASKRLPVPLYSLEFDGPEASTGGSYYTRPVFLPPVLAESIEHILSDQIVWEILERLIKDCKKKSNLVTAFRGTQTTGSVTWPNEFRFSSNKLPSG